MHTRKVFATPILDLRIHWGHDADGQFDEDRYEILVEGYGRAPGSWLVAGVTLIETVGVGNWTTEHREIVRAQIAAQDPLVWSDVHRLGMTVCSLNFPDDRLTRQEKVEYLGRLSLALADLFEVRPSLSLL